MPPNPLTGDGLEKIQRLFTSFAPVGDLASLQPPRRKIHIHTYIHTCNISGSPFSVERLIQLQGFKAVFGQQDHRKRKSTGPLESSTRKKCRTI
ncbi:Uncharacterized protein HZ326_22415 [Fusarium oxysporum f. sp. albedinis]|nr:Uncharacterized protein HZ326_22415 [Fusarium oxysporum f. sp. albedinis]